MKYIECLTQSSEQSRTTKLNNLLQYHLQQDRDMFAKIIDNPLLPFNEQKEVLKAVIQTNIKSNLPEVRLQLTHNYTVLKPILLIHWKYSLRIVFSLFNWQLAIDFLNGDRPQDNIIFDLLLALTQEGDTPSIKAQYLMVDLFKTYKEHWKALIILGLSSEIYSKRIEQPQEYNWFLPAFISISAHVIQNYLTVKNQSTKSSDDRTESDLILVNNCEQWVTKAYLTLLSNLRNPNTAQLKRSMISAFSQILGALYEAEREGHLDSDRLHKIMKAGCDYVLKNYSLDQTANIFLNKLRELRYNNPVKKIEVPQKYNATSAINTQGICWLLYAYLEQGSCIYSQQRQLDIWLLIYSQLLKTPFKLRTIALQKIKSLVAKNIKFTRQLQINYPLALLLFHVYHYQRHQFNYFVDSFQLNEDTLAKINRSKRILQIVIDGLNVEKTSFILEQLDAECLSLREILLLVKLIGFDFVNVQLGKKIQEVFKTVISQHGTQAKSTLRTLIQKEREVKHNTDLCDQLSKLLL